MFPTAEFGLVISGYATAGGEEGEMVLGVVESCVESHVEEALEHIMHSTPLTGLPVRVAKGSLGLAVDDLSPRNGQYSYYAEPSQSIGVAGSMHTGSLGRWVSKTAFVTNCQVVASEHSSKSTQLVETPPEPAHEEKQLEREIEGGDIDWGMFPEWIWDIAVRCVYPAFWNRVIKMTDVRTIVQEYYPSSPDA